MCRGSMVRRRCQDPFFRLCLDDAFTAGHNLAAFETLHDQLLFSSGRSGPFLQTAICLCRARHRPGLLITQHHVMDLASVSLCFGHHGLRRWFLEHRTTRTLDQHAILGHQRLLRHTLRT
jgi:hypothetical protein